MLYSYLRPERPREKSTPISVTELLTELDKAVIGQTSAKQIAAAAVRNHYLGLALNDEKREKNEYVPRNYKPLGNQTTLLIGGSGVGKTQIVQTIGRCIRRPFSHINTAGLTPNGIVGQSPDDIYTVAYMQSGRQVGEVERGIVFLDEFDKIIVNRTFGGDASLPLLRHLEGTSLNVSEDGGSNSSKVVIDTSEMLYFLGGSFNGLTDIIAKRINRRRTATGFTADPLYEAQSKADMLEQILHEDLVAYGMPHELVGRIASFAIMHPLNAEHLNMILTELPDSVLVKQQRLFELYNIELIFSDKTIQRLAEDAYRNDLGARGLESAVKELLSSIDPEELCGEMLHRWFLIQTVPSTVR